MTVFTSRNRDQWLSVAQFLGAFAIRRYDAERAAEGAPLRGEVAARVAPSAINFGGCVAPQTASAPDGNHGENLNQAQA